jgi:hypothetical protein
MELRLLALRLALRQLVIRPVVKQLLQRLKQFIGELNRTCLIHLKMRHKLINQDASEQAQQ